MSRLALALLLAAAPAAAMPRKPRMDKSMETEGAYCGITTPGHRVIETPEQWKQLWKDLGKPAPPVDFSKHVAVAAFAGLRNSGGYGIVFEPAEIKDDMLVVRYSVTYPKGMAIMALTQPYAVKIFPRSAKKVRVSGRDE